MSNRQILCRFMCSPVVDIVLDYIPNDYNNTFDRVIRDISQLKSPVLEELYDRNEGFFDMVDEVQYGYTEAFSEVVHHLKMISRGYFDKNKNTPEGHWVGQQWILD